MKPIKPASARTLSWLSAALVGVGCLIMSPSGALLALALASLFALIVSLFGKGKLRIFAVALLLASLGLALGRYPEFKHEQSAYRRHHHTLDLHDR